jgi:ABC-type transport system involved in cytochrome c biogenesis permease component
MIHASLRRGGLMLVLVALGIVLVAAIGLVLNANANREGVLLAMLLGWHALVYLSALRSALIETLPAEKAKPQEAAEATA